MVLDHSQVVPSHKNGDSRTNVSQLGTPKHAPHLYPRHKQDQPIPLLSWGPGLYPNLDSKPPHLRPGLSVVLRHKPFPASNQSVSPERAETYDKRVTSFSAPIIKYVLRIISL
jgi:hypothetical protein